MLGGELEYERGSIAPWWKEDKDQVHAAVWATVHHLDQEQEHRRQQNLHHLRLYSNRLVTSMYGDEYAMADDGARLKLNVIRACIDAAVAQIATNRPRPMYVTEGGSRPQKERAKNLGKFVMGQFYAMDQYDMSLEVFRDAGIFGTGFEKVYEEDGKIKGERVFPDEVLVDDLEARDCDPRQLFQHKIVTKEVLREAWPKCSDDIEAAGTARNDDVARQSIADRCSVIEAWHLPSGDGAEDGRHVIVIQGKTLVDEPWEYERFPFAVFRWSKSPLGFYGTGIAEELNPIQTEINYLLWKIQESMNLAATQIWSQKGSVVGKLSNKNMAHREYAGQRPPVAVNVEPLSHQYYSWVLQLWGKAFEQVGISQLNASSQLPKGLDGGSGEALKTYNDIGSRRFQHVGQRWETFHVRGVAELILQCARAIESRDDGDLRVLVQGNKDLEELSFGDVSIDKDKYVTKVFPTSLLPDTPTGKIDTAEKLAKVFPGIQRYMLDILDVPDLESIRDLLNAPIKIVDLQLDQMLEKANPQTPFPSMDLAKARERGTLRLLQAEADNYEEDRLELVRQWLVMIDSLVRISQQGEQQAPPQGAQPPGPMAAPPPQQALPPQGGM